MSREPMSNSMVNTGMQQLARQQITMRQHHRSLLLLLLLGIGSSPVLAAKSPTTIPPAMASSDSVIATGAATPQEALKILGADPVVDPAAGQRFLKPDVAFALSSRILNKNTLELRWKIADTYYLYRDKFKFKLLQSPGVQLQTVTLPPGKIKKDPYFGNVEVFFHDALATVAITHDTTKDTTLSLQVGYQGCTELGLCYPPVTRQLALTLPAVP